MGLILGVYGRTHTPDYRSNFSERHLTSYKDALKSTDDAYRLFGNSPAFVRQATSIYHSASAYEWPEGMARIRISDNWILAILGEFDPLLMSLKITNGPVFSQFESYRYERALGRGFGICSQNSEGLADLLHRRYGLDSKLIGLGGHVILRVKFNNGLKVLSDPSTGIALPFSLRYAEAHLDRVEAAYTSSELLKLARTYDPEDNIFSPDHGSGAYAHPFWRQHLLMAVEAISDPLTILLPLIALCFLEFRSWLKPAARNIFWRHSPAYSPSSASTS